jgi:hypothetical protein
MEEGEQKNAFALSIANLMKYNATNWNRNIVHDDVILKDLTMLSKGAILLEHITQLQTVKPLTAGGFKEYETERFGKKNKFNKFNKNNKKKKFRPR